MSAAPKDPMAGITAVIKQIKETETVAREENEHVKQLISIQDSLIEKQRKLLVEVAKQSAELLAVEEKRNSLKEQLCSQKTKLLVSASEGSEGSSIIDLTLNQPDMTPAIANSASGRAALKAIEQIQQSLFTITDSCLKTENLTVSQDAIQALILETNEVIQQVLQTGAAKETSEDTVRRQSFVIAALVPQQPTEEE